ncbi:MAG TPA: response regulator transcription factor [Gaiellaceae bacterium]|nr:response regulator transcription factor [Gaiellaceae bacterium]
MSGVAVVIEDDEAIGGLVTAYLEREGFAVRWERTGGGGLEAVEREDARIVVLDVGLPDVDGFDVCSRLRRASRTPVLMLTARDEEVDRIVGLELGADDYMTKPFSPRELVARVRAILRRTEPEPQPLHELGDVVIDTRRKSVTVAGEPVQLRTLEFELLAALAETPDRVISRDELLKRVWGTTFPSGTRTVDVHVAQVRKKLGRPDLIATVRGSGYRLRPPE